MGTNFTKDELWKAALGELELTFSRPNYKTWLKDSFIASYQDNVIEVGTPNNFTREWLANKYHTQIAATLRKLDPQIREIRYTIQSRPNTATNPQPPSNPSTPANEPRLAAPAAPRTRTLSPAFAPQYTFETFIVGNTNQLAYASSKAVAEQPGKLYNPLFIYGGVGLGKTHLLHAIGNTLLGRPEARVVYVSCETFTNDFIAAIQSGKMSAFKKKYREVDALLVDDIQFIANKEGTQEEFFHTFNTLHQTNHQIVIAADRPPNAIPGLEERLSSRFGWGMVSDIQAPNRETREAILRAKLVEKNLSMPDEALLVIVELARSNIRELEGALTRVLAYAQSTGRTLGEELVREALREIVTQPKDMTVDNLVGAISTYFKIDSGALKGGRRTKELVYPRQLLMYLLRHELQLSFPKIGALLGGKDHTTIMHGCGKIEHDLAVDTNLQSDLAAIKNVLAPTG